MPYRLYALEAKRQALQFKICHGPGAPSSRTRTFCFRQCTEHCTPLHCALFLPFFSNRSSYSWSGYAGEARAWQAHDAADESKGDGGAAVADDENVEICRNRKRHQQLHIHLQKGSLDFGAVSVARFHGKFTRTVRRNIYRRHEVNVAFPFFCRNVL